jgi:hypothetical protein
MMEVSWTDYGADIRCNVVKRNFYIYNAKIWDDDFIIRVKSLRVSESGNIAPISTNTIFLPDQISWTLFSNNIADTKFDFAV